MPPVFRKQARVVHQFNNYILSFLGSGGVLQCKQWWRIHPSTAVPSAADYDGLRVGQSVYSNYIIQERRHDKQWSWPRNGREIGLTNPLFLATTAMRKYLPILLSSRALPLIDWRANFDFFRRARSFHQSDPPALLSCRRVAFIVTPHAKKNRMTKYVWCEGESLRFSPIVYVDILN